MWYALNEASDLQHLEGAFNIHSAINTFSLDHFCGIILDHMTQPANKSAFKEDFIFWGLESTLFLYEVW